MNQNQTQILFAPDIKKIEELGANWYNIVLDITQKLEQQGFHYSRTLGFVNDRELSEEELAALAQEIVTLALGQENLLYFNANIISNAIDITNLFKK